jgi:hypothetical protein
MNESDPLIRRLADANPVPQGDIDGARRPSAERLLAEITSGRGPRRAAGRHARVRLLVTVGLVFAAVVAVAIIRVGGGAPATAAELLTRTAAVAEDHRESSGRLGPYVYAKTVSDQLTTSGEDGQAWSVVQPIVEETWIAADGSGRIRSVYGEPRFLGPRDQVRWQASGAPEFPSGTSDDAFPAGVLRYEDLESLPTDPDELLSVLREQVASGGLPGDVGVFRRIGQLLGRGDAPPELRASLYRAASRLPGIELVGPVTDPTGRLGVGVGMTYDETGAAVRLVMIFDQETSALLAQERILLEPSSWVDAEPGTLLSFVAYLESGRTDSIDSPPTPTTPSRVRLVQPLNMGSLNGPRSRGRQPRDSRLHRPVVLALGPCGGRARNGAPVIGEARVDIRGCRG